LHGEVLSLLNGFDDVLSEPFVIDLPVIALDVGILLYFSGSDLLDGSSLLLGTYAQLANDVLRAVVHPNSTGLAAPFYDLNKAANDPFSLKQEVDLNAQPFAIEVVEHVQQQERPSIT
jgi:hypothetical protein